MKNVKDVALLDICHIMSTKGFESVHEQPNYIFKKYGKFYNQMEGTKYVFRNNYTFCHVQFIMQSDVIDYFLDRFRPNILRIYENNGGIEDILHSFYQNGVEISIWDDAFNSRTVIAFHSDKSVDYTLKLKDILYLYLFLVYYKNLHLGIDTSNEIVLTGFGIGGVLAQCFYLMVRGLIYRKNLKCKTYNTPNVYPYINNTLEDFYEEFKTFNKYIDISFDDFDTIYAYGLLEHDTETTLYESIHKIVLNKFDILRNNTLFNKIYRLFKNKEYIPTDEDKLKIQELSIMYFIISSALAKLGNRKDPSDDVMAINTFIKNPNSQNKLLLFKNNIDISGINKKPTVYYDDLKAKREYNIDNFYKYLNDDGYLYPGKVRFTVLTNILSRYISINKINYNSNNPVKSVRFIVNRLINDNIFWNKYFTKHQQTVYIKALKRVDPYILGSKNKIIIGIKTNNNIIIDKSIDYKLVKTHIL